MSKTLDGMQFDVPLGPRTTLELGGAADVFLEVYDADQAAAAIGWARRRDMPVSCLGGGSNLLIPDEGVRGLVLAFANSSVEFSPDGGVLAPAGASWPSFVDAAVEHGLSGVECLAGIPGSVGATPIQNVGAYGQEVCETITSVGCLDLESLERVDIAREDCAFSYRNSRFKEEPGRFLVCDVRYQLHPGGAPARRYAELIKVTRDDSSLQEVRDSIVRLRRKKSMVLTRPEEGDPNRRSAGSFFTNPIVAPDVADEVAARLGLGLSQMPHWPADIDGTPMTKLAAGWLIERAGFSKGHREGAVGLSTKHALALVHHGGGTTAELLRFASSIRTRVHEKLGVWLEREPRLLQAIA